MQYELLNLRALEFSALYKNHFFLCMSMIFCANIYERVLGQYDVWSTDYGIMPWWPLLGPPNWYSFIRPSRCNSFDDTVPVSTIFGYLMSDLPYELQWRDKGESVPGSLFTKNTRFYWYMYRDSHYKPDTVVRPPLVYIGNSYTRKTAAF